MAKRRKIRVKPSNLIVPDPLVDAKYNGYSKEQIEIEIEKCKNGLDGLKYFINTYVYVPNKIKPEILKEKPTLFKHIQFEKEKINLKLYPKQEEYLETLLTNRLIASYKSRQCLPAGSMVYTPFGPVEIQNLRPNDVVYSYNEYSGEIEVDIVVDALKSGIRKCEAVLYSNGKLTEQGQNHPFLLSNDELKKSIELESGDELRLFDFDGNYDGNIKVVFAHPTEEKECLDIETLKNKNFIFEGLVVHNTGISTITQAYILLYSIFNENKEIVIVSKTEADAIKFLDAIYYMYNHLPFFLRRQYSKAVKKSFHIGSPNMSTKITVLTSTSKSGRSFSATILILDECEFIEHADDLLSAAQPTLSATGGQALLISTPWMYKSLFWRICHGEDDAAFKTFKINLNDIPGRDKEWYDAQCAELSHDRLKIMTELDMQWIVPFQRYYTEEFLNNDFIIKTKDIQLYHRSRGIDQLPPKFLELQRQLGLNIILPPVEGLEYYFGVDPYEGGRDSNAGLIIGNDMKVYAYFKTQRLDIFELVKFLCDLYNTKVCIERNRGFYLIKEFENRELHTKYVLFKLVKRKNVFNEEFGYIINGENRKRLITSTAEFLKYIHTINTSDGTEYIKIPEELMEEMQYFVIKKSKVEGLEHDDLIFALIGALYARDNKNMFYNWKTARTKNTVMDRINGFYDNVNTNTPNVMLKNGKLNTLMARNFLAGKRGQIKLTVDQLDILDQVIRAGKEEIELVKKQKQDNKG